MQPLNINSYMQSRSWWIVLVIGILLVLGGFCYWFWPVAGYAVASVLFGWLLIVTGLVQLCVSAGVNRPRGWGWWLAGGVIDLFVGFALVRNVILAESVFPYFMAFIFFFWGLEALASAGSGRKYWWLSIINGILMLIIGYFFIEGGIAKTIFMSSFLISIAFIYWGFTVSMAAYEMRPRKA